MVHLAVLTDAWCGTGAGYYFGNLAFVKENFTLVILAIVLLSVVPVIVEVINERRRIQPATVQMKSTGEDVSTA